MLFFNLDVHIGVISDIKHIFEDLGHQVDSWTLSPLAWVLEKQPDPVDVVNRETWKKLNRKMCQLFFERYRSELSRYDGFICTYPPAFAMLYEHFCKPIIVVAATRYEYPFTYNPSLWNDFNNYMILGIDNNIIIPVANNLYDSMYAEYFTGRTFNHIPSLCDYTSILYQPSLKSLIYWSHLPLSSFFTFSATGRHPILTRALRRMIHYRQTLARGHACNCVGKALKALCRLVPFDAADLVDKQYALPAHYCWKDLGQFKAIVHVPYNVSIMSIFEQYAANIPLFFPSFQFLKELRRHHSWNGVLTQISWNQYLRHIGHEMPSRSLIEGADSVMMPDPNDFEDLDGIMEWVKLADFYDTEMMPHLIYFDSAEHLKDLLHDTDYHQVSEAMRAANEWRKEFVYSQWQGVLDQIQSRN